MGPWVQAPSGAFVFFLRHRMLQYKTGNLVKKNITLKYIYQYEILFNINFPKNISSKFITIFFIGGDIMTTTNHSHNHINLKRDH